MISSRTVKRETTAVDYQTIYRHGCVVPWTTCVKKKKNGFVNSADRYAAVRDAYNPFKYAK